MQIRNLLDRDLNRKIEEIIQIDQMDAYTVYTEISEYVVTDSIRRQYRDLLEAINEARTEPTGASASGSPASSARANPRSPRTWATSSPIRISTLSSTRKSTTTAP